MANKKTIILCVIYFGAILFLYAKTIIAIEQKQVEDYEENVRVGIKYAKSGKYENAKALWENAAKNGNPEAKVLLGSLYADGKGVTKSDEIAFKWYFQAANQGYPLGQYYVASCYNAGKGITKDPTEAFRWYRLAAEQGNREAQYNVGSAYYNGVGVNKDKIQAYAWIYSSLQNGFEFANEYLEKLEKQLSPNELVEAKQLSRMILNNSNVR